jgi:transposase
MCPYQYYAIMRNCKDKKHHRYQMVIQALGHGIKPAARHFHTTPPTVRKWLYRFKAGGFGGLEDQSKRPHNSPGETPRPLKQHIVQLKHKYKRIGAEQIKILEGIPISAKTMRKVWREGGIPSRIRRKKHKTKNNLREVKKRFNLFELVCEDTKELRDIPEYWPLMTKLSLPKVQYTFREVSCGILYMGFADEMSLTYATLFSDYLQFWLGRFGLDLSHTIRQTDNGSEYIGSWNAKEPSSFTVSVESIVRLCSLHSKVNAMLPSLLGNIGSKPMSRPFMIS